MSQLRLVKGSCADQEVDVVVNAANRNLLCGGGICGVIYQKAGIHQLTEECRKYKTPLKDGDAVITSSCSMKNVKAIIHAVGPDFFKIPAALEELCKARKYKTPLKDGDAVITSSCSMKNVKAIIHAVGPDFFKIPAALEELCKAYYNSMKVMMEAGYHQIAFPLISSGIFGGLLAHPVKLSTRQCYKAYRMFIHDS